MNENNDKMKGCCLPETKMSIIVQSLQDCY